MQELQGQRGDYKVPLSKMMRGEEGRNDPVLASPAANGVSPYHCPGHLHNPCDWEETEGGRIAEETEVCSVNN